MSILLPATTHRVTASRLRAFTLVEVALALGIAVFCLMVVFGLLNVGVATSSASFEQTVATDIVSSVAADLRTANPGAATVNTTVYGLAIPAALPRGCSRAAAEMISHAAH